METNLERDLITIEPWVRRRLIVQYGRESEGRASSDCSQSQCRLASDALPVAYRGVAGPSNLLSMEVTKVEYGQPHIFNGRDCITLFYNDLHREYTGQKNTNPN